MLILIRHPDGRQIEVTEETFTEVYQGQGFERVSETERLSALTRDELNAHAEDAGVADPASYPNKAALIEAIAAQQAIADPAVEPDAGEGQPVGDPDGEDDDADQTVAGDESE
jgi:hypothetical protein